MAGDLVPHHSLVRRVYNSPLVTRFLAAATAQPALFHMADEFQCINIMYMYDGCSRAWHYDGTDTVITLLLQRPVQVRMKRRTGTSMNISTKIVLLLLP